MLSQTLADRINLQINREMYSAYLYMAMSAKLAGTGYLGVAKWLMTQFHEEMFHAMKFYTYLIDQGAVPVLAKIDAPEVKSSDIKGTFQEVLKHEKWVTVSIRELLELAQTEKDYGTENLVRWYINEQLEEEKNANEILQNLELMGDSKQALYMLNLDLATRAVTIPLDFSNPALLMAAVAP